MRTLTQFMRMCFLMLPASAALLWTSQGALRTLWAMATIPAPSVSNSDWFDEGQNLALRRQVQRHFLEQSIYVPLEDIAAGVVSGRIRRDDPSLLMQKACGQGKLLVWLPFKFNLPIVGEKVLEWCWKPQTKDV